MRWDAELSLEMRLRCCSPSLSDSPGLFNAAPSFEPARDYLGNHQAPACCRFGIRDARARTARIVCIRVIVTEMLRT